MERVLLVDDMRDWVDIAARALARCSEIEAVRSVVSLQDARAVIKSFRPTVVVTDLRLDPEDPRDLAGLEVCKAARTMNPQVGLVVVTGSSSVELIRSVLDLGAEFLDKAALGVDDLRVAVLRAGAHRGTFT